MSWGEISMMAGWSLGDFEGVLWDMRPVLRGRFCGWGSGIM